MTPLAWGHDETSAPASRVPLRSAAVIAFASQATAVGVALFWTLYYTVGMAPAKPPACYEAYEAAFLWPDLALAAALFAAGPLIRRRHPAATALTSAAGGALMFLGGLDVSFNLQQGVYAGSVQDLVANGVINLYALIFGATAVVWCSRTSGALRARRPDGR
jgi:hypothetical protein